jgi:hypothetical protein
MMQWSVDSEQWSVDSEQWSVDSEQWSVARLLVWKRSL